MAAMQLNTGTISLVKALKTAAARAYHAVNGSTEKLIKGFEGCRLKAYKDSAGVWTIGWGNTRYKNGAPVKKGDTLPNIECANDLLEFKLKEFADDVNRLVKVPLNQNQFDALVSFHYNTGALGKSTLLKLLNAGDYAGAAAQFGRWVHAGGKVLNALVDRRAKEMKLFLKAI